MIPTHQEFRVAAVSSNRNAFGLFGMIIVARNGLAYEVGANDLNVKHQGDTFKVPYVEEEPDAEGTPKLRLAFEQLGFEIPNRRDDAPDEVLAIVWGADLQPGRA